MLRKEFALLNAKAITQEEENEQLIQKLTALTMKSEEVNDFLKDKDEKIFQLEQIKLAHLSELDALKSTKEHLMQIIQEKNKEIEKIEVSNSSTHIDSHSKGIQANLEEIEANFYGIRASVAKKLEISDHKSGSALGEDFYKFLTEETTPSTLNKEKPSKKFSSENEAKPENFIVYSKDLERKLEEETLLNETLREELGSLKKEFKAVLNSKLPQIEEIKKNITNVVRMEEAEKFEKEKIHLLKDLQNRVDKVCKFLLRRD